MKNLITIFTITIMVMLLASCGKQEPITDLQAEYQNGDMINEVANYVDFVKLNEQIEAEGYEPITITEDINLEELMIEDRSCSPCYPWLSDISVYNLGGNNRGFSVNGGRHHPCSYELSWYVAGSGTIINWQSGGFASMTFPSSGTYHICVVLTSSTTGTSCYAFSDINITI